MTHYTHHAELLDHLLHPENHRMFWLIHARRRSDFATVEEKQDTEEEARIHAQHYFARGFDVRVYRVKKSLISEWKQGEPEK